MLDDLYQEYSDKIDEKFEQTEILIQELIGVVNENQSSISDTKGRNKIPRSNG